MKLIPHNKSVGLILFGALIITAVFLFITDKFGGAASSDDSPLRPTEGSRLGTAPTSDVGRPDATSQFNQVDWRTTLSQVGGASDEKSISYALADLRIIENPTKGDLRTYTADLKKALVRYSDPTLPNEVKTMLSAYEAGDPKDLLGIDSLIDLHNATLSDLTNVKVPSDVAFYHVTIMNAIKAIIATDFGMKKVFTDQDLALAATKAYTADVASLYNALQKISTLLQNKGIKITTAEELHIYLGFIEQ